MSVLVDILEPVLTGGIRNTNFFNGRLLAAEDLTDFQTANAAQHRQLGRAIGEGVAYGFEVDIAPNSDMRKPVLHITRGLAVNRNGQAVALSTDVDLAVVPQAAATNAEAGLFAECQSLKTSILTNPGLYILTVVPASDFSQESAPKTEVSTEGFATTCGSRWAVEGAKFRVVGFDLGASPSPTSLAGQAAQLATQLDPLLIKLADASGTAADQLKAQVAPLLSKFRNCVAHLCFGTEKLARFPADPFGRANGDSLFAEYGVVDQLRDLTTPALTDCDVPLAVFYWTSTGLQYVDMWSVRRPIFPQSVSGAWAPLAGERRLAEGLAMFLQFQCQISGLMKSATVPLSSAVASDFFLYLPALGLLPVPTAQSTAGFDYVQFFSNRTHRDPFYIEGAKLVRLFHHSLFFRPIDFGNEELIWLYWVRENMDNTQEHQLKASHGYLVFTNGQISFEGQPKWDLNYWNYANYV